jgi:hypothetical protein
LPSITPSYLYTFIALIAVSSLLVFSFTNYTEALRASSEVKQLKSLMDTVAAKSTELLTLTSVTNATINVYLQMPTVIGNKLYWIQLDNDSVSAWVQGGFGDTPTKGTDLKIQLPKETAATGHYIGGYGAACLMCYSDAGISRIQLNSSG